MASYKFMLTQFSTIQKSSSIEEKVKNISVIIAAVSFTYFFFNPSIFIFMIWLITPLMPVFAAVRSGGVKKLEKVSKATKSMALVAFCSLIVSSSINYILPFSPIYDPDFFAFIDELNKGNYALLKAYYASNDAMLNAIDVYLIIHSNQNSSYGKYAFLVLNKSVTSTFKLTSEARVAFYNCKTHLQRSWFLQKDLVLGLEFQILYLDLIENATCFFKIYGDLFYYRNKSLLQSLAFYRNTTEVLLNKMQDCVNNASIFVQIFFMQGFSEAKKEELKLLNDMYSEAFKAFFKKPCMRLSPYPFIILR
ncbi:MAG: hypothetical protein QXU42_07930 [Thermoproteota archaeon]